MPTHSETSIHSAQSRVDQDSDVCHTQPLLRESSAYNADLLEKVENLFDDEENRRVANARQGKMIRRLSREHREGWSRP